MARPGSSLRSSHVKRERRLEYTRAGGYSDSSNTPTGSHACERRLCPQQRLRNCDAPIAVCTAGAPVGGTGLAGRKHREGLGCPECLKSGSFSKEAEEEETLSECGSDLRTHLCKWGGSERDPADAPTPWPHVAPPRPRVKAVATHAVSQTRPSVVRSKVTSPPRSSPQHRCVRETRGNTREGMFSKCRTPSGVQVTTKRKPEAGQARRRLRSLGIEGDGPRSGGGRGGRLGVCAGPFVPLPDACACGGWRPAHRPASAPPPCAVSGLGSAFMSQFQRLRPLICCGF